MTFWLTRFTYDSILPLEIMSLHVIFGDEPCSKIVITKFMMVNIPSAYNTIIGQPTLNRLRIVVPTYHMVVKFPIRTSVGELRSNPRESHQCNLTVVSPSMRARPEALSMMDPQILPSTSHI